MEISVSAHLQESCDVRILASSSCSPSGSLVEASSPSPCWVLPFCLILSVRVLLFSTYTRSLVSKYHLPAIYSPVYHLPKTSVPSFKCLLSIIPSSRQSTPPKLVFFPPNTCVARAFLSLVATGYVWLSAPSSMPLFLSQPKYTVGKSCRLNL